MTKIDRKIEKMIIITGLYIVYECKIEKQLDTYNFCHILCNRMAVYTQNNILGDKDDLIDTKALLNERVKQALHSSLEDCVLLRARRLLADIVFNFRR